jgi:hypothetical protein
MDDATFYSRFLAQAPDVQRDIISTAVERYLRPLLPTLSQQFLKAVEPAAKSAVEIVRPAIRQELDVQIPKLAIITGAVAGTLVLLGIIIGRKLKVRTNPVRRIKRLAA